MLEFILAYVDNLIWLSIPSALILGIAIPVMIDNRVKNIMDKDDWTMIMQYLVPLFLFFLLALFFPGTDHIKMVHENLTWVKPQTKESNNEESIYPSSASCDYVGVCRPK